jgi:ectoine hydroxylase-related dioxygenase (phytanoyl-CoA dioxygenase family)
MELLTQLDAPYKLVAEQVAFYRENGFVHLNNVLPPPLLEYYRTPIREMVEKLSGARVPLEKRSTYGKAFLQVMNLWTKHDQIRKFVFGKRLARIATDLMGCRGVRVYHDQALYKEPGGGFTPWHADQYYWPVSSDNTITAWVPLQDTPLEMGPLAFCPKSHHFQSGRDLEISDESEMSLKEKLDSSALVEQPFTLGDVSFHSGWTFHRAGANRTTEPREVMTIIYIDMDMTLMKPKNKDQVNDIDWWCPGVNTGEVIASPLNPVIYSSKLE